MSERGTAFNTDDRGGMIATSVSPAPVSYDGAAIVGEPPSENETVVFDRESDSDVATSVQVASSDFSDLTSNLLSSFEGALERNWLTDEVRAEVVRMAADRAARIERPIVAGKELPGEVRDGRIALASAAMALLAIEAKALAPDKMTARNLHRILRRQRPSLRK